MEWSTRTSGNALVAAGRGRIDETSWEAFHAAIIAAIADAAGARLSLTLDLGAVDYMSSRGLRVLTLAKRAAESAGVTLTLARPNAMMREILAISRYDRIFTITTGLEP